MEKRVPSTDRGGCPLHFPVWGRTGRCDTRPWAHTSPASPASPTLMSPVSTVPFHHRQGHNPPTLFRRLQLAGSHGVRACAVLCDFITRSFLT